jgi:mono/diheme cytochrome c family protein
MIRHLGTFFARRLARTSGAGAARAAALGLWAVIALLPGCEREDMHNQPRYELYEESDFFADGSAARPRVEGTVASGQLLSTDPLLVTRAPGGGYVAEYPIEITRGALERGRQRYDIYCAMCHGATGFGDGMVVRRGFVKPPSLHDERLRNSPPGYFADVITHGFGAMYSYGDRVTPEDRWKIAAYVKTLQFSRNADLAMLPPEDRQRIEESAPAPASAGGISSNGQQTKEARP